jgi:hypothetical protein
MEQEADADIDRHPGQVEQRQRPGRAQEGANLVQVAQRAQTIALSLRAQRHLHNGVIDSRTQPLVQSRGDAHHDARTNDVQHALEGKQRQRQDREGNQRRHAPAREHAVIDLEHVERAGQVQDVDQAAHQPDGDEGMPACRQSVAQLRGRRRAGRRTGSAYQRHESLPQSLTAWAPLSRNGAARNIALTRESMPYHGLTFRRINVYLMRTATYPGTAVSRSYN